MILKEDIEHLKGLARVEFGEKETKKLAEDLGAILSYVDELKEADILGVPEMTHSVNLKNIFRKDEWGGEESSRELINSFPEKYDPPGGECGEYLKVQPIL